MIKQYRAIRRKLGRNTLLFFRLGDFYEMFFEDAKIAADILEITLTKRNGVPMCGVPYHSSDSYLKRLIKAGKKVAICEQTEEAGASKGIVKRDITSVITPGTVLEPTALESTRNNYLAALVHQKGKFGLAILDISTGTFWLEEAHDADAVRDNLLRYVPSECIIPEKDPPDPTLESLSKQLSSTMLSRYEGWTFDYETAYDTLLRHFKIHSLRGFGCEDYSLGISAAGAVLHYLTHELRHNVSHIRKLSFKEPSDYLLIDKTSASNLELLTPLMSNNKGAETTLLAVLDNTQTAMGSRLLRNWIVRPLNNLKKVRARHQAVQAYCDNHLELKDLRGYLKNVKDIERLVSRLSTGSGNARDVRMLADSLRAIPSLKGQIPKSKSHLLQTLDHSISPLPKLEELIESSIKPEPPVTITEGNLICEGYSPELDELRSISENGKQWLANYQTEQRNQTGIKSLKIRHNKVFGYYIEITKSNLSQTPASYTRKQTLVNSERFITPELKEYETKIFRAQERAMDLEHQLFLEIRLRILEETDQLQQNATAIAQLDLISTFAERALSLDYIRPEMKNDDTLNIQGGRHPVIEQIPDGERFVPNDTKMNGRSEQLIIITGPNMAGKSTYIRQVALLVIMAQTGSFIPADKAVIGLTDRVFTRVGASDDLARGRSTFMVEMQETANILHNATPKSLIVLDEIGRGTSTFDGISIAWAVAEYLCSEKSVKAKTLFATHYHELTELAQTIKSVKNYNVLVKESNKRIIFLRKIAPGASDQSYGIHVARLAGLPDRVLERADEILQNLEEGELTEEGEPGLAKSRPRGKGGQKEQLSLL